MRQTGRAYGIASSHPRLCQLSCGSTWRQRPRVHPLCTSGTDPFDHSRHPMNYLGLRVACQEDRRAALVAAIEAVANGDIGLPIATAVIAEFRKRAPSLATFH
ncbi:hypothetical protein [Mesorhizobium tianshanense]|uniref:hypothetical protein n=1 Tax=Mesorhizobium tianshanense TaxID=39844 RepID=UPI001F0A9249|nr:hypothetical protein [Mesorhizobium tianshanense]